MNEVTVSGAEMSELIALMREALTQSQAQLTMMDVFGIVSIVVVAVIALGWAGIKGWNYMKPKNGVTCKRENMESKKLLTEVHEVIRHKDIDGQVTFLKFPKYFKDTLHALNSATKLLTEISKDMKNLVNHQSALIKAQNDALKSAFKRIEDVEEIVDNDTRKKK
tara:strand:- start:31 stop:525 length:495 start_codon:yes stop_codon:yes gene_type:complete